jgi:signal transduction histidine kinase
VAVRLVGSAQDITERKQAELRLRESEQRYRTIVELAEEDLTVSTDGTYAFSESVPDDATTQRRRVKARLIALATGARRHKWWALLVAVALELAFLIPMGVVHNTRSILGLPGSLLTLTVVITAVLVGWQAGLAAAIAGGVIFWATVAEFGEHSAPLTLLVSTGVWATAALIAGFLTDALRDQTRRRRSAAVALARAETRREQEARQATQEERARIARDLHDSVTQSLFAASLKAEALAVTSCDEDASAAAVAADVRRLNRGALAQMRMMLLELRGGPVERVPLQQLLRNLVEASESRASVKVALTLDERSALRPEVHEAAYRITQEALNNIVRHAKAQHAWVQLETDPSHVLLVIADDGRGFDPGAADQSRFGLRGMRERAEGTGGDLTLVSALGEGTTVTVEWRIPGSEGSPPQK